MDEHTVRFKSYPFFFYKEKSGLKPNTLRKLELNDVRYGALIDMIQTRNFGKIWVTNSEDEKILFIRQITDVSYYEGYFIISWEHEE